MALFIFILTFILLYLDNANMLRQVFWSMSWRQLEDLVHSISWVSSNWLFNSTYVDDFSSKLIRLWIRVFDRKKLENFVFWLIMSFGSMSSQVTFGFLLLFEVFDLWFIIKVFSYCRLQGKKDGTLQLICCWKLITLPIVACCQSFGKESLQSAPLFLENKNAVTLTKFQKKIF